MAPLHERTKARASIRQACEECARPREEKKDDLEEEDVADDESSCSSFSPNVTTGRYVCRTNRLTDSPTSLRERHPSRSPKFLTVAEIKSPTQVDNRQTKKSSRDRFALLTRTHRVRIHPPKPSPRLHPEVANFCAPSSFGRHRTLESMDLPGRNFSTHFQGIRRVHKGPVCTRVRQRRDCRRRKVPEEGMVRSFPQATRLIPNRHH